MWGGGGGGCNVSAVRTTKTNERCGVSLSLLCAPLGEGRFATGVNCTSHSNGAPAILSRVAMETGPCFRRAVPITLHLCQGEKAGLGWYGTPGWRKMRDRWECLRGGRDGSLGQEMDREGKKRVVGGEGGVGGSD